MSRSARRSAARREGATRAARVGDRTSANGGAAVPLRAVPLGEGVARPLTLLYGLLARWRETAALPRWHVEVAWLPGLAGERACPSSLTLFPTHGLARIVVDPRLSDSDAEHELLRALAELQLHELEVQLLELELDLGELGRCLAHEQAREMDASDAAEQDRCPDWEGPAPD